MKDNHQELKDLTAQREKWITRIFWLGFEIALIFAVPAALGAWLGTKLGGGDLRSGILVGTFVFSWAIVIYRYRQMTRRMQALDSQIKTLQQQQEDNEEE